MLDLFTIFNFYQENFIIDNQQLKLYI